jgi:LCP family protein required for cell wall assembly
MRIPGWMFIVGVVGLVALTGVCSVVTFSAARQFAIDAGSAGIEVASFSDFFRDQPTPTALPTVAAATQAPPTPLPGETAQPTSAVPTATLDPLAQYTWDDPRQVRILLMGIDQRSGFNDDEKYFRTDTMMVVNIDPIRQNVGVLSIPRDLLVDIPDGGVPGRINTANSRGDSGGYPGGGPALALETVRQSLGLRVDNYLLVNFDVFVRLVDLVAPDGVEICVSELIDDPDYPDAGYGTIAVRFEPGCQRLDGERLLQYARTRATEGSDFDRARRQQEVLKAVQQEVVSLGGVGNLIAQVPALWEELSGSFKTNLTMDQIIRLGALVTEISSDDITSGVIDNLYVTFATTGEGDQVLIPNYAAIRGLISRIFNPQEEVPEGDLRARALAENAPIAVFNNSDTAGLAGQTRDWLVGRGLSVAQVGNTPDPTNSPTVIRYYGGFEASARYLATLMSLPIDRVQPGADGLIAQGVAVVVGTDIQPLLTGG